MTISDKMPLTVVSQAMDAFLKGELKQFDALVGENACHIRASKVAELANRVLTDRAFAGEVQKIKDVPIRTLPQDLAFLVNCYFLNVRQVIPKGICYEEKMDDESAGKRFGISKNQAAERRKEAQKAVSQASVEHIQQTATPSLLPFVSGDFRLHDRLSRSMIPCYMAVKAILKQPHYFVVDCKESIDQQSFIGRMMIVYKPEMIEKQGKNGLMKKRLQHIACPMEEVAGNQPVVVLRGYAVQDPDKPKDLRKELLAFSLRTLFLTNAAQHDQYGGEFKSSPIPFSEGCVKKQKFEAMKELANTIGCSLKNPTLFCIDHMYASTKDRTIQ